MFRFYARITPSWNRNFGLLTVGAVGRLFLFVAGPWLAVSAIKNPHGDISHVILRA
jgi:hypothetical protein